MRAGPDARRAAPGTGVGPTNRISADAASAGDPALGIPLPDGSFPSPPGQG